MAYQTLFPQTFVFIIVSLISAAPALLTIAVTPAEVTLNNQTLIVSSQNRPHPLTPPGKPAPEDSSSTGSTT